VQYVYSEQCCENSSQCSVNKLCLNVYSCTTICENLKAILQISGESVSQHAPNSLIFGLRDGFYGSPLEKVHFCNLCCHYSIRI